MKTRGVFLAGAICAPLLASAAIRAITPVPQDSDPKSDWMKRHEAKLAAIAKGDVGKVVFIGDSITHIWERPFPMPEWKRWFAGGKYKALNLGYGADRTEHVLWRLDHGELVWRHRLLQFAFAAIVFIGERSVTGTLVQRRFGNDDSCVEDFELSRNSRAKASLGEVVRFKAEIFCWRQFVHEFKYIFACG